MARRYYNVSFPYIEIYLVGQSFSLVLNQNDKRQDYFNSLTHKRYMESANTATINLTYVPKYNEDPNQLEAAIAASKGYCTFRYGHFGENTLTYVGQIVNYTTSINSGYLQYTLQLVSRAACYNYTIIKDNAYAIKEGDEGTSSTADEVIYYERIRTTSGEEYRQLNTKPSDWDSMYRTYFYKDSSNNMRQVTGDTAPENFTVASVAGKGVLGKFAAIVERYMGEDYTFDIQNSECNIEAIKGDVIPINQTTPMMYMQRITKEFLIDAVDHQKNYYKLVVDDRVDSTEGTHYKGTIRLVRTGAVSNTIEYTFDWNSRDCDVLSWTPSYDGSYSIFGNFNYLTENTNEYTTSALAESDLGTTSYKFDNSKVDRNNFDSFSLATIASGVVTDVNTFAERINYPYKATIEVLGLSRSEIDLVQTHVKVNCMVAGQLHASSGEYIVTGIEDSVSSRGFITKLDLVRYQGEVVKSATVLDTDNNYTYEIVKRENSYYYIITNTQTGEVSEKPATPHYGWNGHISKDQKDPWFYPPTI